MVENVVRGTIDDMYGILGAFCCVIGGIPTGSFGQHARHAADAYGCIASLVAGGMHDLHLVAVLKIGGIYQRCEQRTHLTAALQVLGRQLLCPFCWQTCFAEPVQVERGGHPGSAELTRRLRRIFIHRLPGSGQRGRNHK